MTKLIKKPSIAGVTQWNVGDKPLPGMHAYGNSVLEQYPAYKGFYFIEAPEGVRHVSDGDYVGVSE